MKNSLILLFSFLMFSAFSLNKNSFDKKPDDGACAVKVNFGSAGGGIDLKTYDAIKKMIDDRKLKFTEKNMGREGEKEICLPLTELKKKKKTKFINQLKSTAAGGQFVSVSAS